MGSDERLYSPIRLSSEHHQNLMFEACASSLDAGDVCRMFCFVVCCFGFKGGKAEAKLKAAPEVQPFARRGRSEQAGAEG